MLFDPVTIVILDPLLVIVISGIALLPGFSISTGPVLNVIVFPVKLFNVNVCSTPTKCLVFLTDSLYVPLLLHLANTVTLSLTIILYSSSGLQLFLPTGIVNGVSAIVISYCLVSLAPVKVPDGL